MGWLDQVYAHLPVWAQHGAASVHGLYRYWLRFGRGYAKHLEGYEERENFTQEQWETWQRQRLSRLLSIAAAQVPYYQQTWNKEEKAAALAGRVAELPLLEKDPVRSDPKAFLRRDVHPLHPHVFHSSGSTGTPVASIWTVQEVRNSRALREARSARWSGVSFKMPRAVFSGRMVEPDPQSEGPYYRFNVVDRQVYFSTFHLRPDTARFYVEAMHRHGIQWLTGYAFSYYLLAGFMMEQGLKAPSLKAVITTSEKLTQEMRRGMERAYRCRVYEQYSTVEMAVFASECEHGRLHVSPDAAAVEILRPDGSPCKPEEPGEVVSTCLIRDYQPFIRFRLGDVAVWDSELCPCGRAMPVLKEVVGRIEDVVIGPDGRRMVRFHGIFVDQPHVREGQIIQERLDRIRVKVVPTVAFAQDDMNDIAQRVKQRLGLGVEVIVEPVESIPRTAAGKFQAVISLLPKPGIAAAERTGVDP